MLKRWLPLLLLSAAVLSACGFHLRGKLPLADSIKVIAVESTDLGLRDSMVDALKGSGATVVADPAVAKAVLDLHKVNFKRTVRTIDNRGKVTGYTLEYLVSFKVKSADGGELRDSGPIAVRRDYNFDPNQVLQAEDEEQKLREDMQDEIAQRILRQLATIAYHRQPHHTLTHHQAGSAIPLST